MIRPPVFLLAFFRMTFDGERERPAFASRGPAALFLSVAALVYSQSALGAYVRHLEAGLACPDFPTCLGTWFPPPPLARVPRRSSPRPCWVTFPAALAGGWAIRRGEWFPALSPGIRDIGG